MQVKAEQFKGHSSGEQSESRAHPREEGALVREGETNVRLIAVRENRPGESLIFSHRATVRKPALAIDESGVLWERAEFR